MNANATRSLTLTKVVFELGLQVPLWKHNSCLTLTKVVFECGDYTEQQWQSF